MKKHKFLKTLLSSLMVISTISTTAIPAIAEEAEAETEMEVVETVEENTDEEISTSDENGDDTVIDVPGDGNEDGGGSEIIIDIPVDEDDEGSGGIGVDSFGYTVEETEVTVTAEAPKGAFPDGTEMTATNVEDQNVIDLIKETAGEGTEILAAIDITFTNDGEAVQPDDAVVKVAFASAGLTYSDDLRIVHVHEDENKELTATVLEPEAVTETEDGGVAFDADSFSVYAVVGGSSDDEARATVNFYGYPTTVDGNPNIVETVYVKGRDTLEHLKEIVCDPGVGGSLDADLLFQGWTTNPSYTLAADQEKLTIENIRSYLDTLAITEGSTTINYYPVVYKVFKVSYLDPNGVCIAGEDVLAMPTEGSASYTISESYTSTSQTKNFDGWNVKPGDEGNVTSEKKAPYPLGTTVTLSGNVSFVAHEVVGFWLIYDENGKGATYNAPAFVSTDPEDPGAPEPPLEMKRPGYEFKGWYTGAPAEEGGDPTGSVFTFGTHIQEPTRIYAKWELVAEADYTVAIWLQNAADTTKYDFKEAVTLSGTSNSAITIPQTGSTVTDADGSYINYVVGTEKAYLGFHADHYDTNKTVDPAGNTVVNVYYNRNMVELRFWTFNGTGYTRVYDETPQDGVVYYGRFGSNGMPNNNGNNYYQISYYTTWNSWVYPCGYSTDNYDADGGYILPYDGRRYNRNGSWQQQTSLTMRGLYGTELKSGNYTWPNNYNWYSDHYNGGGVGGTRTTFMDSFLPSGNSMIVNLYGTEASGAYTITWYKQNADLTTYTDANSVASGAGTFLIADKYDGYYPYEWSSDGETWTRIGTKDEIDGEYYWDANADEEGHQNITQTGNLYIRFNRLAYPIKYFDGTYFDGSDGDGSVIADVARTDGFGQTEDITYGTDISAYGNKEDKEHYKVPTRAGYVFEGWYQDETCRIPAVFTTMPVGGVTVYAKWRQIEYRVFLHPQADVAPVNVTDLNWGSPDQAMTFRRPYGSQVSLPGLQGGVSSFYDFIGWYTDPETTKAFNVETKFTEALNEYYKTYDKHTEYTDPINIYGNLGSNPYNSDLANDKHPERFWITQKLDLYGKWSAKLDGADGILVVYDATEKGEDAPEDQNLYKDNVNAIAKEASKAKDANEKFLYWVLQTYDADNDRFDDVADSKIYPGGEFTVLVNNAKIKANQDGTKTYEVHLRAEYGVKEVPTDTHIDWYSNVYAIGATAPSMTVNKFTVKSGYTTEETDKGKVYKNTGLKINEAVDIPDFDIYKYENYKFVGWAKNNQNATEDQLFLKYDYTDGKYKIKDSNGEYTIAVTQVAADEVQNEGSYDDLYAIWKAVYKIKYSSDLSVEEKEYDGNAVNLVNLVKQHAPTFMYGGYYVNFEPEFNGVKTPYTAKQTTGNDEATAFQRDYWKGKEAYTAPGNALVPAAGTTYFVKEVPGYYLQPFNQYYFKENYGNFLTEIYMLTAIDDTRYNELGFARLNDTVTEDGYNYVVKNPEVVAKKTATVFKDVKFETSSKNYPTQTRDASSVAGQTGITGRVAATDITGLAHEKEADLFYNVTDSFNGVDFNFVPYYVTLDGVTVYGKIRRAHCGTGYVSTFTTSNTVISTAEISNLKYDATSVLTPKEGE